VTSQPQGTFAKLLRNPLRQSNKKRVRTLAHVLILSPNLVRPINYRIAIAFLLDWISGRSRYSVRGTPSKSEDGSRALCERRGASQTSLSPSSERQAAPHLVARHSHPAHPIGFQVPQIWLDSLASIPLRCLKSYAILVQIICQTKCLPSCVRIKYRIGIASVLEWISDRNLVTCNCLSVTARNTPPLSLFDFRL
jgi:hypothetical protein